MRIPCVMVLLATVAVASVASAEPVEFSGTTETFSDAGPSEVSVGDLITVTISGSDPRSIWTLSINYEKPENEQLPQVLALVTGLAGGKIGNAQIGAGGDTLGKAAQVMEDSSASLDAGMKTFIRHGTDSDLSKIKEQRDGLSHAIAAFREELDKSTLRPEEEKNYENALNNANEVLARADSLIRFAWEAISSRTLKVRVRGGYERITLRVCGQGISLSDNKFELSKSKCSESTYSMTVRNPLGSLYVGAGLTVPFFWKKPTKFFLANEELMRASSPRSIGNIQPTVSIGPRWIATKGRERFSLGVDIGFGLGDKIGKFYTLGGVVGIWGLSIGSGLFIDTNGNTAEIAGVTTGTLAERTESIPLVGWYVKLSLTNDLWSLFGSSSSKQGAQNSPKNPAVDKSDKASDKPDKATTTDGAQPKAPSAPGSKVLPPGAKP